MHNHSDQRMSWRLLDWERELINTRSWNELSGVILDIPRRARMRNSICNLISPSGQILSIGIAEAGNGDNPELAATLACVNHQLQSGDPPYQTIVGNDSLDFESAGVVVFRCEDGEWTEILTRNCVPVETMVVAVKHFFETESLPDWLQWEEV